MKKLTVATIALSAAAVSLVATPSTAGPEVPGPKGFLCGYTAATDPNPEADANDMSGEIDAGPATTDVPGILVCTIQVNSGTHNGPDAAVREFPADANGVIAGVQTVTYSTEEDAQDFLCTSFRKTDGSTIYFTGGDNARWHTNATEACSEAIQGGTGDVWDIVDGALCPELADEHPDRAPNSADERYIDYEGDVFVDGNTDGIHENQAPFTDSEDAMADLFYDCPVYTFTSNSATANPDRDHDYFPLPNGSISAANRKVIDYAP